MEASVRTLADDIGKLRSDIAPVASFSASQKLPSLNSSRLVGKRIVWVDDQPATTQAVRDELKREGIETVAVTTTKQLEDQLKSAKFDLIVSDLRRENSPGAGLDYFEKINNESNLPPRLLFAPKTLIDLFREDIDKLSGSPNYLPPITSSEEFYQTVYEKLAEKP